MSNRSKFKHSMIAGLNFIEYSPEEVTQEELHEYMNDPVIKPKHYTSGSIEVINIIKDSSTPEQYEGFLANNIKKYVLRYQHKNGVEDLRKAQVYLGWLIDHLDKKDE